jgi:hypothetical protein
MRKFEVIGGGNRAGGIPNLELRVVADVDVLMIERAEPDAIGLGKCALKDITPKLEISDNNYDKPLA